MLEKVTELGNHQEKSPESPRFVSQRRQRAGEMEQFPGRIQAVPPVLTAQPPPAQLQQADIEDTTLPAAICQEKSFAPRSASRSVSQ